METMRESWTDERLDDLRNYVVDFRAETKAEFAAMRGEFASVHEEFTAVRQEMKEGFDGLQRLMIQFMGIMIVALVGLIASLVATIQL